MLEPRERLSAVLDVCRPTVGHRPCPTAMAPMTSPNGTMKALPSNGIIIKVSRSWEPSPPSWMLHRHPLQIKRSAIHSNFEGNTTHGRVSTWLGSTWRAGSYVGVYVYFGRRLHHDQRLHALRQNSTPRHSRPGRHRLGKAGGRRALGCCGCPDPDRRLSLPGFGSLLRHPLDEFFPALRPVKRPLTDYLHTCAERGQRWAGRTYPPAAGRGNQAAELRRARNSVRLGRHRSSTSG